MRFSLVQQGIEHVRAHLKKITQINNTLLTPATKTVSWNGRLSGIQREVFYPLEYQYLLDNQQYSFLLTDASFFQFYYHFSDDDILQGARLAYFPRPIAALDSANDILSEAEAALERNDEPMYEYLYNAVELIEANGTMPSNTSHIRFDFDPGAQTHEPSHLQFGGVQDFRIPSGFVPQPLAFVQLCESLVKGCNEFDSAHIGFARNNRLDLATPAQIIALTNQ